MIPDGLFAFTGGHTMPKALDTWNQRSDALLGTMTDDELALQLGITKQAVQARRVKLGVLSYSAARCQAALNDPQESREVVTVSSRIPKTTRDMFLGLCKMRGRHGQEVIEELIVEYLAAHGYTPDGGRI
jgi:hypothetical protein